MAYLVQGKWKTICFSIFMRAGGCFKTLFCGESKVERESPPSFPRLSVEFLYPLSVLDLSSREKQQEVISSLVPYGHVTLISTCLP